MPTRSGKRLATIPEVENATPGLSAYELQRLANIKANEAVLASLNLTELKAEMGVVATSANRPSQRGVGTSRKRSASPALPSRTSARAKNIAPDYTGVKVEHSDGRVVLESGDVVLLGGKMMRAEEEDYDPLAPTPFHRLNNDDADEVPVTPKTEDADDESAEGEATAKRAPKPADARDIELITLLANGQGNASDTRDSTGKGAKAAKGGKKQSSPAPQAGAAATALSGCTLDERMVVKACKSAVVHMHFQPRHDTLLLAAGDKDGNVSVWHASRAESDPSDGVHLHKPHQQYVSGLSWGPRSSQALYSASYDGTIKCLDLERREFTTSYYSEEHELSAFTMGTDCAWIGTNDGRVGAVDIRTASECVPIVTRHNRKVNALSVDASGRDWLLASASTDATVRVWDVRKLQKPVATMVLPKASQGAEWAPDGSTRLAVTCFDDHLRVFDLSDIAAAAAASTSAKSGPPKEVTAKPAIKHCTQTGRWVVPFRATWTALGDGVLVGGMKRTAEVYDASSGKRIVSLSDPELMTAIPSRNAAHANGRAIACATNSGRIHIFEA